MKKTAKKPATRKAPAKKPAVQKAAKKKSVRRERKPKKKVAAPKKKVAKKKAAPIKRKPKTKAKPVGRPTRYQKRFATELPAMFKNGESVAEVCVELGICKQTFYTWTEAHPEFLDAYNKGRELSEAWWHKIGRANATGRMRGNAATWIFNMKNRFGWKDRTEVDSNVTIGEAGVGVEVDDEDEWNAAAERQQAIMKGLV